MKYLKTYKVFELYNIDFEYDVNFLSQDVLDQLRDIFTPLADYYPIYVGYNEGDDTRPSYYYMCIVPKNYGLDNEEYIDFTKLIEDFNFILKYLPTLGFSYVRSYGVVRDKNRKTKGIKLDRSIINNLIEVGIEFGPDGSGHK